MSHRKKDKTDKTIAARLLEGRGIPYEQFLFPETVHDAMEVAEITGHPTACVFKTLVTIADENIRKPILIMIPADQTLDPKKAARALGVKRLRMARQSEAEELTGLKVGGISALALQNRSFSCFIDVRATRQEKILVSAGRRGINLKLDTADLIALTGATRVDVISEEE